MAINPNNNHHINSPPYITVKTAMIPMIKARIPEYLLYSSLFVQKKSLKICSTLVISSKQ